MSRRRFDAYHRLTASGALLFATLTVLAGCDEPRAERGRPVAAATLGVDPSSIEPRGAQQVRTRAWLEAGQLALERPTLVDLPHAEWGGFRGYGPNARGIAFVATEGQVLEIELARPHGEQAPEPPGAIALQVFLLEQRDGQVHQVPLGELAAGESSMQIRMPRPATYVVRLQPAPLTDALYYLELELGAALPSPLRGFTVASFFGASRDAGRRHHEGVDIFAPRRTPVLAVADGRATYRENKLGGHSVWVNAPGVSYYYAHLERVAVGGGEPVRAGDVLGYVGDSGNAASVGPHLHFGIYKWGKEPVDPMPLLVERRFTEPPDVVFELPEPAVARPKCSARFPDSISTLRVCMASESHGSAAPLELVGPATLPIELAITAAVLELELAGEGLASANPLSASIVSTDLASANLARESPGREGPGRENRFSPLACSPSSSGLPAVCAPVQSRRVMLF